MCSDFKLTQNAASAEPQKWRQIFAEVRPNFGRIVYALPSRTEPNVRPNSSAEVRRSPNFGPSLSARPMLQFPFRVKEARSRDQWLLPEINSKSVSVSVNDICRKQKTAKKKFNCFSESAGIRNRNGGFSRPVRNTDFDSETRVTAVIPRDDKMPSNASPVDDDWNTLHHKQCKSQSYVV